MQMLYANEQEASFDKHIPVNTQYGNDLYIKIGENAHPMTKEHSILWVALLTDRGLYTRMLNTSDLPEAHFSVNPDEYVAAVYAYCDLHGLWIKEQPL